MIKVICLACRESFEVKPYRARTAKYCSYTCSNGAGRRTRPDIDCPTCGETFYPRRPAMKFCSRSCSSVSQRKERRWVDSKGYVLVTVSDDDPLREMANDRRQVKEHRLVMARSLGRPLLCHETVHHKDGNRQNNASSNLELWSTYHSSGQRVTDLVEWAKTVIDLYGPLVQQIAQEAQRGTEAVSQ